MTPKFVTPVEAKALIEHGAVLIDIREPAEFLREHVPGATSFPVSDMIAGKSITGLPTQQTIIFYCQAGSRTSQHAEILIKSARTSPVLLLTGGINGWKAQTSLRWRIKNNPFLSCGKSRLPQGY